MPAAHALPVLLLMVKDEERGIEAPMRSAALLGIRDVLIIDTGSTDGTIDRARALGKELDQLVFFDAVTWPGSFAVARNECLQLARGLYPMRHALFLDADDEVTGTCALTECPAHTVIMRMGDTSWTMPRVIRLADPMPDYEGVVHEIVRIPAAWSLPSSGLTVTHHAGKPSTERWKRDEVLLAEDYARTKSPRSLFYWAQTVECLAGEDKARLTFAWRLYAQRAERDASEEGFVAGLRSVGIQERLGESPRFVLADRLALHELFPSRPEPLVDAAFAFLREGQPASAYLFAKAAQQCEPHPDALFLRRTARWNQTYDILSRACLRLPGRLEEGLQITLTAARNLKPGVAPHDWPRVNLGAYRRAMGIVTPFPEEAPDFVGGPDRVTTDAFHARFLTRRSLRRKRRRGAPAKGSPCR